MDLYFNNILDQIWCAMYHLGHAVYHLGYHQLVITLHKNTHTQSRVMWHHHGLLSLHKHVNSACFSLFNFHFEYTSFGFKESVEGFLATHNPHTPISQVCNIRFSILQWHRYLAAKKTWATDGMAKETIIVTPIVLLTRSANCTVCVFWPNMTL